MASPLEYAAYAFAACTVIFIVPGQIFFLSVYEGAKGVKRGVAVLLGVLVAEVLLLTALFAGLASLLSAHLPALKAVGAVLLVWLGLSALRSALRPPAGRPRNPQLGSPLALGFIFTILNPPFVVWLLTVGVAILSVGVASIGELAYPIFASAVLVPSAAVTLAAVLLAAAGRKAIGERGLRALSAVSGVAFLALAASVAML